ncbi:hypothetical protein L1F30_16040 [Simiduia sp. 21SJ11W-1]|uniref:hypothetical protein n=1 Tax=Simiduia sp. 21SJ11W-1 TaxID=2909669 RepID=UPI00209FCF95|nr:hypothetical protein [Simiduia sp. 21SJ11W-1]UTA47652.1 hypothetical protein L1F30_16040 [Simiduia sp. 21SJ11W-1]
MALSVPHIPGYIQPVTLKYKAQSYGLQRILTLIRQRYGVTPISMRELAEESGLVFDCRSVAIALADFYSDLTEPDVAEYFSVPADLVRRICDRPYYYCNLELYSALQAGIEQTLTHTRALNCRTGRMLTYYEFLQTLQEPKGADQEDFIVSGFAVCSQQEEDDRAHMELGDYFGARNDSLWEERHEGNDHPCRWNVCLLKA